MMMIFCKYLGTVESGSGEAGPHLLHDPTAASQPEGAEAYGSGSSRRL